MHRFICGLAVLALATTPGFLCAQEHASAERTLHLVFPVPGQEVWFRVNVDSSTAPQGEALQLVSSSGVVRGEKGIAIQTPAEVVFTTSAPVVVTFSAMRSGNELQAVIRPTADREILLTGEQLRFGRSQPAGLVEVRSAGSATVRHVEADEPQP